MAQERERADPSIDGNENKDWSQVGLFCLVGDKRVLGRRGRWPEDVEKHPGVIWRGQQRGGAAAPGGGACLLTLCSGIPVKVFKWVEGGGWELCLRTGLFKLSVVKSYRTQNCIERGRKREVLYQGAFTASKSWRFSIEFQGASLFVQI